MIIFRNFYDFPKIRPIMSHGAGFFLTVQFTVLGFSKNVTSFMGIESSYWG